MSDYIEREAALIAAEIGGSKETIKTNLKNISSADVVEVVRCKDCKKYMTIHCTCDGCCISDEWYCADGERGARV